VSVPKERGKVKKRDAAHLVDCEPWMGRTEILPLASSHIRTRLGCAAGEQRGDERSEVGRESSLKERGKEQRNEVRSRRAEEHRKKRRALDSQEMLVEPLF